MSRSWRKRATALLLALLVMVALFLGWTSYNYTSEMRKTIEEENARSAALWASMTGARLDTAYEHIYELMIALYNNTLLRFDTPIMSAQARIRIVDMMSDKLLVSEFTDAFFVFDTQNDYYLFSAKNGLSGQEVTDMKTFARENALELASSFGNNGWSVHRLGSGAYYMRSVRLGKYCVGALSNVRHYSAEQMVNVFGADSSCLLDAGGALYFFGGDRDISGETDAEALHAGRLRGYSVVSSPLPAVGGTLFIASRAGNLLGSNSLLAVLLLIDAAACLLLVIYLLILLRRKVAKPTAQLIEANQRLASGDTEFRLDAEKAGSREFRALYDSYNNMAAQIVSLRIEAYDMKLAEEQNKLTMLRAQLKPHHDQQHDLQQQARGDPRLHRGLRQVRPLHAEDRLPLDDRGGGDQKHPQLPQHAGAPQPGQHPLHGGVRAGDGLGADPVSAAVHARGEYDQARDGSVFHAGAADPVRRV